MAQLNMNNIQIIFCILLVRVQNILKLLILKFFWRFKLMATIHWQINIYDQFYSFWTCQWSLCRTVMAISSRFFLCQSCFPSEKPTHCLPTCTSTPEELCGHAHFRRLSSHAPAPSSRRIVQHSCVSLCDSQSGYFRSLQLALRF